MKPLVVVHEAGGARGIVTVGMWQYLSLFLFGSTIQPLGPHVALTAGCSVGGLLSLLLASGFSPGEMRQLILDFSAEVFSEKRGPLCRLFRPKYKTDKLEGLLRAIFGGTRLGDLETPVAVTAVDASTPYPTPFLLKSWEIRYKDISVVDAVLATTAAPSYFEGHRLKLGSRTRTFLDGGFYAANPIQEAIVESRALKLQDPVFLGLGTGREKAYSASGSAIARKGALFWMTHASDVFIGSSREADAHIARKMLGDRYIRFDPMLEQEYELDSLTPQVLDEFLHKGMEHVHHNLPLVAHLKRMLCQGGA